MKRYWLGLAAACGLLLGGCAQPSSPSAPVTAPTPSAAAPTLHAQSHDRYQNLAYTVTGPRTVKFDLRGGFRASFYTGICRTPIGGTAACTGPSGRAAVGDYVDMSTNTSGAFTFGDGSTRPGLMIGRVEAVDSAADLLYARAITVTGGTVETGFTHTYPTDGPFTARFNACCRLDGANTDGSEDYRVSSVVSVLGGNTGNPVTTLPPVVDCVRNTPCSFPIPAADPDGHVLSFRLATPAETDLSTATLGNVTSAGIYTVPAQSAPVGSVFATQIVIEERLSSGALVASTPVDFMIRLVDGRPPAFTQAAPFPTNGQVFTVNVGTSLTVQVQAVDPDGTPVTVSDLGLPPGATFGGCVASSGTTTCTLNWTPEADEAGSDFVVAFTARDASNVTAAPYSFTIRVPANTPPTLTVPADRTAEATSALGASVTFTATATDVEDGNLPVTCTPASGSVFPQGTTTVTCAVTDSGGLSAEGQFTVTVADTTPPTITAPADVTVHPTTGQFSAPVTYALPAATDTVSSVTVTCTPASGSVFPLGTTTVTCTATDEAGNSAQVQFQVNVRFVTAGFFQPVRMNELNVVKAGSSVPLKFSLGGDWGLDILGVGAPSSTPVSCSALTPVGGAQPTDTAGGSSLSYGDGQYVYVWKTQASWAGTCRTVSVTLRDGSVIQAAFRFR